MARLAASLILLAALWAWVAVAGALDAAGRAESPDALVHRYFAALENDDAAAALEAIAPAERTKWSDFIANGLNNRYRITGIAVAHASLVEVLRGAPPGPRDVTVFLDITQWADGARWQAGPRVPLLNQEGRWYLQRPPLAPGSG